MRWKLVVGLILAVLIAVLAAQNAGTLTVRFFFWSFQLSQALVIFLSGIAGLVIGWLLAATGALKK